MALATWVAWADAQGGAAAPGGGAGGLGSSFTMLIWMAIILLFFFMVLRPQQRERSQREKMIGALKKNDRVVTASGIYGVVTNVQRESDEITLRVDETTNTKIRVTLGSIARVLGDEPAPSDASSK